MTPLWHQAFEQATAIYAVAFFFYGSELECADPETLKSALANRR